MSSRDSVDRVPARCMGGQRVHFLLRTQFFHCPTLVSLLIISPLSGLILFHIKLPNLETNLTCGNFIHTCMGVPVTIKNVDNNDNNDDDDVSITKGFRQIHTLL